MSGRLLRCHCDNEYFGSVEKDEDGVGHPWPPRCFDCEISDCEDCGIEEEE